MANNSEQKYKTIVIVQNWGAGKIPIDTEYKLKDSDRTLKLVADPEYPNGKFVFNDGEEFNPGKYFSSFFVEMTSSKDISESPSVYDEEVWNKVDEQLNVEDKGLIRKTLGAEQVNEAYHAMTYYDVTDIIESIIKNLDYNDNSVSAKYSDMLYKYLNYNNFPFFTKEKLYMLFDNCEFKPTRDFNYIKVIKNDKNLGYLVKAKGKYIFAPKNKDMEGEYKFEDNNATGFFYTAENYLDIALSTIERYKEQFVPLYNTALEKNNESYGYQADASIKTLLAFSCECYLKSLIINDGKDLNEIKNLGHGLSVLYTSLNDEMIGKVFSYMERNGYNIDNVMYHPNFETNDLTEKFTLDLAKVDEAFVDSRYSAERDKNTEYSFLYKFALALRHCSKKEYSISSPFDDSIDSKISKK